MDGAGGEGDGNDGFVLADAHGFQASDVAALPNGRQDAGGFVHAVGRDKECCGAAFDFVEGIAVHSLGGAVPTDDHAVEGHVDDGVLGVFDDGGQAVHFAL